MQDKPVLCTETAQNGVRLSSQRQVLFWTPPKQREGGCFYSVYRNCNSRRTRHVDCKDAAAHLPASQLSCVCPFITTRWRHSYMFDFRLETA